MGVTQVYRLRASVFISLLWFLCLSANSLGTHQLPFKPRKKVRWVPQHQVSQNSFLRDLWLGYVFLYGVYSGEERNSVLTGNSWAPLSRPCPQGPGGPQHHARSSDSVSSLLLRDRKLESPGLTSVELSTNLSVDLRW